MKLMGASDISRVYRLDLMNAVCDAGQEKD